MKNPHRFCDLHIHSSYSDGVLAPVAIVDIARGAGLSAVAITDHDTLAGQEEALRAGESAALEVLTGVEFSLSFEGWEAHLLGYLFDPQNAVLRGALKELEKARFERVVSMLEKLVSAGVEIDMGDLDRGGAAGTLGRLHIARALLAAGKVSTIQEAFARYIGEGSPCFVPRREIGPGEVVSIIKEAGGTAVWAHPGSGIGDAALVKRMTGAGIDGIEAWHPNHNAAATRRILEFARRRGLVCTGGSDYHFDEAMKVPIGGMKVPVEAVERLKDRAGDI